LYPSTKARVHGLPAPALLALVGLLALAGLLVLAGLLAQPAWAQGNAAKGNAAPGDAARGDTARGDAARGDAARGDAAPGDAAKKAREAYARGQKLFEEKRFVGAIAAFERAYKLKPHFHVQCSIARCYQVLNKMIMAAERYKRCLDGGAATSPMARQVRENLKQVQEQITWVSVTSPGKGGKVYVDGEEVGPAPRRVPLDPGKSLLEVRRQGARPARVTINTIGGEEREISLVPLGAGEEETHGGTRPLRRLKPYWFWGTAALTAVLAVTTAILGVQTLNLEGEFNDEPSHAAADRFFSRRDLTNVFFGLTAAAAASGAVLFFFTDFGGAADRRAGSGVPRRVGVGFRGTF
jgi:hypothetical protein